MQRTILAVVFTAIYGLLTRYDHEQRDALARESIARDMATRQSQYVVDKANYDGCLKDVPVSDALRAQFEQDAARWEGLAAIATNPELKLFAQKWADDIRAGSFLATAPKTYADCGPPPIPPTSS